jgi:hypothetical protein
MKKILSLCLFALVLLPVCASAAASTADSAAVEELPVEVLDLEQLLEPEIIQTACTSQYCGRTGVRYGYGSNCTTAQAALDNELWNAAAAICPGTILGVAEIYGNCVEANGQCRYDGRADVTCKICNGQYCPLSEL